MMGCVAGDYNIIADQGATFNRVITWNDSDGDPVDLGGYTARMQVRQRYVSTSTVLSLTSGSGITLGGALGTITLLVSASATAEVATGEYLYDLELVSGGGVVTRLLQGSFTVRAEVTR
jgi:hypothetical protein